MTKKQKAVQNLIGLKESFKLCQDAIAAQLEELARTMKVGETVEVDGTLYDLKDNFADKNTTFRPACFHRLDITEVK
jgi:hypothetical protein